METDTSVKRRFATGATLLALSVTVTLVAWFAAGQVGGPVIRGLLGAPRAFREDFTSPEAMHQALIVQFISSGIAFWIFGVIFGRYVPLSWKSALLAANPVTFGVGFILFRILYYRLHLDWPDEYYGLFNGFLLSLAAPFVFASCFYAGAHVRKLISSEATRVL